MTSLTTLLWGYTRYVVVLLSFLNDGYGYFSMATLLWRWCFPDCRLWLLLSVYRLYYCGDRVFLRMMALTVDFTIVAMVFSEYEMTALLTFLSLYSRLCYCGDNMFRITAQTTSLWLLTLLFWWWRFQDDNLHYFSLTVDVTVVAMFSQWWPSLLLCDYRLYYCGHGVFTMTAFTTPLWL